MKIGIIGLQPRQIADVRGRVFNGHEVVFYDEKTFIQEKVASFSRKVDKVILLPQHVPKRLDNWILKSKLHTMAGGISVIIRYLATLPPAEGYETPVEESKTQVQVTASAVKQIEAKEPKKLFAMVPRGFSSQYTWCCEAAAGAVDKQGGYNYELLDIAVPGDVLRFKRPAKVEEMIWRGRVAAMRSYRFRHKDQLVEAHFYPEYVDLLVMDPSGVAPPKPCEKTIAAVEAPAAEETPEVVQTEPNHAVAQFLKLPAVDDPRVSKGKEAPPVPTAPPIKLSATPQEIEFWEKVYLAALAQNATPEEAYVDADKALLHRGQRFQMN